MRSLLVGILIASCLAVGFATGWYANRPTSTIPVASAHPPELRTSAQQAAKRADPALSLQLPGSSSASAYSSPSVLERLATLKWLKHNGLDFGLRIFNDDEITPEFARLYGLTSEETARLNQAYQQAKNRVDDFALKSAVRDQASTASKLIITVPAFPFEGGQTYTQMLTNISTVLGPERYTLFNDISGDSLESSLGGYGLSSLRYEVVLTPTKINGENFYRFSTSKITPATPAFPYPNMSTTKGQLRESEIKNEVPILKPFELPSVATNDLQN